MRLLQDNSLYLYFFSYSKTNFNSQDKFLNPSTQRFLLISFSDNGGSKSWKILDKKIVDLSLLIGLDFLKKAKLSRILILDIIYLVYYFYKPPS